MKGKVTEELRHVVQSRVPQQSRRRPSSSIRWVWRRCGRSSTSCSSDVEERLETQASRSQISGEAKDLLIEKGFDPAFGARPLRRAIQRYLEDPLSEEILKGTYEDGGQIVVERKGDELAFRSSRKKVQAAG